MLFASPSSAGGGVGSPAAHVLRDDRDDSPTSPPTAPTRPLDRPSCPVKSAAPPSDAAAASSASHRPAESGDHGGGGNAAAGTRGKKAGWSVAASGANETGLVMGADSLAAVSESALRPSAKTSDSDSLESLPDGSSATAPSDGGGTSSSPSTNDVRGANGQTPILPGMPPIGGRGQEFSPVEIANRHNRNPGQQRRVEFMPRPQRGGYRRGGSYNDRRRGINSGGPNREGNGSRRDQERGGYDRNGPRGFSRRDPRMGMPLPPQQAQIQPPLPPPTCYYTPMPPHRPPFMSPMVSYPVPYYVYYLPVPPPHPQTPRNMPFVPHQAVPVDYQATIPFPSPVDHHQLMRQIEFYFSDYNLNTDAFLRNNMDSQGGVPISLVAGFNMVKMLTNDEPNSIPHILTALQGSTVVEVQGDKIRRRDGWVPPNRNQYDLASGPQSPATPDGDSVIALLHTFGLECSSSQHSTTPTDNVCLGNKSASGSSNNQMQDGV